MLALDYLRRSRKATPAIELRALEFINVGYQRLLTFEVAGGGFDWYGRAPANIVLSAYGLLEFSDMKKVYDIDERVIDRTRAFVLSKQARDGSWKAPEQTSWSWTGLAGDFVVTSYVAWSLAEAGEKGEALDRARAWIRAHLDQAKDGYSLALAASALGDEAVLDKLDERRDGDHWKQAGGTMYYATGDYASVETTALAALAFFEAGRHVSSANKALGYLAKMKDARGTWGSTSATILALRAILQGTAAPELKERARVRFTLNGASRGITVEPGQTDVLQQIDLSDLARSGTNRLSIEVQGELASMFQVVARYWQPWEAAPREEPRLLDVRVGYDRTSLSKDETLTANVEFDYRGTAPAFMIVLDLGIPPGFSVDLSSFEKMVADRKIDKFTTTARQITLYFGAISADRRVSFSYSLRAKYPIRAKTPPSSVYEYYSPDRRSESRPVEIEVKE